MTQSIVKESKVVKTLKVINERLIRSGDTPFYSFQAKKVAYILDVRKGVMYSVKVGNGSLYTSATGIFLMNGEQFELLVHTATGFIHSELLQPCEMLRGVKNPFPYITTTLSGSKTNVYQHHIFGLCIYGMDVIKATGSASPTLNVVFKDRELTIEEGLCSEDNIVLVDRHTRKKIIKFSETESLVF